MRVVAQIRRMEDGLPVEPAEFDEVDAEADEYTEARDQAAAKVPAGWQIWAWSVPEHHPS